MTSCAPNSAAKPTGVTLLGRTQQTFTHALGGKKPRCTLQPPTSPCAPVLDTPNGRSAPGPFPYSPALPAMLSPNVNFDRQLGYTPVATPSPWGSQVYQSDGGLLLKAPLLEFDLDDSEVGGNDLEMRIRMIGSDGEDVGPSELDQELTEAEARKPAPPPVGAKHPSIGSKDHDSGGCRRCCFFPRGRCVNGYDCQFCHYEHERRKRKTKLRRGVLGTVTSPVPESPALAPSPMPTTNPLPCARGIATSPMSESPAVAPSPIPTANTLRMLFSPPGDMRLNASHHSVISLDQAVPAPASPFPTGFQAGAGVVGQTVSPTVATPDQNGLSPAQIQSLFALVANHPHLLHDPTAAEAFRQVTGVPAALAAMPAEQRPALPKVHQI